VLPAFGMAVLKSPPQSRSPSLEASRPASATPHPTHAPVPVTAAGLPATTGMEDTTADGTAATAAHLLPEAAAVDDQPSGSKRKRDSGTIGDHMSQPSTSKQPRLDVDSDAAGLAEPSEHTFDLLKSHK